MNAPLRLPPQMELPGGLALILAEAAAAYLKDRQKAFRVAHRPRVGATLRPGKETPLWNALAAEIRPHLRKYGTQVNLGRLLGLDRQTIHAYFVTRTRMPDAERTLQLLTWLIAVRKGAPPS
ncbi:MAG TPA: hypothetical protein VLW52_09765 [Opitutaceae bacterium]|nr:hypothetical protein [Opitutaceae bacterium]